MSRRKPRSPGVMLQGRSGGACHWDNEIRSDGGKAKLHRAIRRAERARFKGDQSC